MSLRNIMAVVTTGITLVAFTGMANADDDTSWMNFGSEYGNAEDWSQPYDRSFARKYESQPARGYPTVQQENIAPLKSAIKRYATIVSKGGWGTLPKKIKLKVGNSGKFVKTLRARLRITGDLRVSAGFIKTFDYYVEKAVKRFQKRHGLTPTGYVDKTTVMALNVPASSRLRQLRVNLTRVQSLARKNSKKYVFVNIPAAQIEAVENGQVVSRHSGVVGKLDRQTPILSSSVARVSFNPYWTVPPTVLRKDLIPKARQYAKRGRDILKIYHMTAFTKGGNKLDPASINWQSDEVYNYVYRQDPWEDNSMGFVKIHFPNRHAVFLHDTPSKSLFGRNFRADSSGCVRVQNVSQLVAWILKEDGWDSDRVAEIKRTKETLTVRNKARIPLMLAYVTAWATPDGVVQFRRDLYGRDNVDVTASAY
ncbi:MAG: L,D-transpeptidase family protein [bacterium]|nr:L,D-transpeptidase family protein [bacterium]